MVGEVKCGHQRHMQAYLGGFGGQSGKAADTQEATGLKSKQKLA